MQVAYDYRRLANISCNLRETFVPLRTISCNLRETIVPLRTSPATCGRPSYLYEPSPAICGRLSYHYKHLLQLAGDLRTPTNISCNLRETIVPLQTSPAICGRPSYPYEPSPAICGRPSYPYKKVLQLFFSLTICASYRKPYFCFIKIQYPEEIIRKYTQLSR